MGRAHESAGGKAVTAGAEPGAWLERLERGALRLAERRHFVLFSHRSRFASPLVPAEREELRSAPAITDPAVQGVVEEVLLAGASPRCAAGAPPAIFFPAPLARAFAAGDPLEAAIERFHYDLIHVDDDQRWTWRGVAVAARTRAFFLEHTRFEPALGRWVFEYRVNEQWWDKSYLEAMVTPFVATALEGEGPDTRVVLQDGRRVALAPGACRLDRRERLLLPCAHVGEALCSTTFRFLLLRGADDELRSLRVGDRRLPLLAEP